MARGELDKAGATLAEVGYAIYISFVSLFIIIFA